MFEDGSESYKLDGTTPTFASTAHLMFVSENRVRRRGAQVILEDRVQLLKGGDWMVFANVTEFSLNFCQTAAWLTKQQL